MKALLAIDGSDASNVAVTAAASLAWPEGSEVEIVSVIPIDVELFGGPWPAAAYAQSSEVRDRLEAELGAGLVKAAAAIKRDGLLVSTRLLEGRPASEIVRSATADGVDLIILGARGHGTFERLLLGSVSAEVVDLAPCPVLVARHSASGRVLAGADGSPDAQLALDFLAGLRPLAATRPFVSRRSSTSRPAGGSASRPSTRSCPRRRTCPCRPRRAGTVMNWPMRRRPAWPPTGWSPMRSFARAIRPRPSSPRPWPGVPTSSSSGCAAMGCSSASCSAAPLARSCTTHPCPS